MKRKFRLIKTTDFKRVRRLGKSYAHPLVVLIKHPNQLTKSRIGIITNRSIGTAVKRNRVKRILREILRPLLPAISPGWDIILLARRPITHSDYPEIKLALNSLLSNAKLLEGINLEEKTIG